MNTAALRAYRRWVQRWTAAAPVLVWHHPAYRLPAPAGGAPMNPRRADDALTVAVDLGFVQPEHVFVPDELPVDDALRVHTPEYLATLDRPEVVGAIVALDPQRLSVSEWMATWRRACAGTVAAARTVAAEGGRAVNLLGGFHHAAPDRGGGYCGLNDVAIAVARLRSEGFSERIAVIDLDAHPPDGIVAALGSDPLVDVLSLSAESEWSLGTGVGRTIDLRVPRGTGDEAYLRAVDDLLTEFCGAGLVFYLAGADPIAGDPLGALAISEAGLRERDRRVLGRVGRAPLVVLPAGGYHPSSWRVLGGTIAEASGSRGEIPTAYDPIMRRTRTIARGIAPLLVDGPEEALITEEELLGGLGLAVRHEQRFLGYYTRHGLEAALTAYGFLGALRRMGFDGIEVHIEVRPPAPDRLVISARVGGERVALVDLAASIRTFDGFRCLFVDWLELIDPRGDFTSDRPPLPGQRRPGLGLATETMQLLGRAAERLSLAGVAYTAAHFHVAWMARESVVPIDPELRGKFRALVRAVSALPLSEASRVLATTGVHTEDGAVVRWEPLAVVAPVSADLRDHLAQTEAKAAEAEQAWVDRLLPLLRASPATDA